MELFSQTKLIVSGTCNAQLLRAEHGDALKLLTLFMETHLAEKNCAEEKESSRLSGKDIVDLKKEINEGWQVVDGRRLKRNFKFNDFMQALNFVNRVGEVAEGQNHHPDVYLTYGQASVEFSTHSAGGLTRSDFILAAKVDALN